MIKLKGHSEFSVKIINKNDKFFIEKSSFNIEDFKRLQSQINKQQKMYENNFLFPNIKIPRIIKNVENSFIMEYIHNSDNVIDFIIRHNIIRYTWFIKNIICIIETYISKCNLGYINIDTLTNKINNVIHNIINNNNIKFNNNLNIIFEYLKKNINIITKTKFPIGICHGDLTLSNILIDSDNLKLYLIDFLDSFIDTPILDIVKIRQDTKYLWSLNMYHYKYDINKTIIILNYIDINIDNYFKKYDFYVKGYKFFQILNLLRVLQYSKNRDISEKLINNILSCYSDNTL